MSWSNYERSMKLAQQCRFYTTEGGKTPGEIKKAEEILGVKFSKQYKDFCKNYGYLSFYGNEIFGIDPDNLEILEGNCVAYALNDRKVYELPRHYIPIYDYGYEQENECCWEVVVIGNDIEYIKVFMEYEADDLPMVYFYEVDLNDKRFALRGIEVFVNRKVKLIDDLYYDAIEACPIPTVDEFNAKIWGEGFNAAIISKEEFERIWITKTYDGSLIS